MHPFQTTLTAWDRLLAGKSSGLCSFLVGQEFVDDSAGVATIGDHGFPSGEAGWGRCG